MHTYKYSSITKKDKADSELTMFIQSGNNSIQRLTKASFTFTTAAEQKQRTI
jgi:hypothetical protein